MAYPRSTTIMIIGMVVVSLIVVSMLIGLGLLEPKAGSGGVTSTKIYISEVRIPGHVVITDMEKIGDIVYFTGLSRTPVVVSWDGDGVSRTILNISDVISSLGSRYELRMPRIFEGYVIVPVSIGDPLNIMHYILVYSLDGELVDVMSFGGGSNINLIDLGEWLAVVVDGNISILKLDGEISIDASYYFGHAAINIYRVGDALVARVSGTGGVNKVYKISGEEKRLLMEMGRLISFKVFDHYLVAIEKTQLNQIAIVYDVSNEKVVIEYPISPRSDKLSNIVTLTIINDRLYISMIYIDGKSDIIYIGFDGSSGVIGGGSELLPENPVVSDAIGITDDLQLLVAYRYDETILALVSLADGNTYDVESVSGVYKVLGVVELDGKTTIVLYTIDEDIPEVIAVEI